MFARRLSAAVIAAGVVPLSACGGVAGAPEPATVTVTVTATPSTETVTPVTTTASAADACDPANFLADFTEPVVMFCDGAWARAGQAQTDHVLLYRHAEDRWRQHPHDSRAGQSGYFCYDEATLREEGAPEELIAEVLLCDSAG